MHRERFDIFACVSGHEPERFGRATRVGPNVITGSFCALFYTVIKDWYITVAVPTIK